MTESTPITRRAVISLGSVTVMGAGALALAACTTDGASSSGGSGSVGSNSGSSNAAPSVVKLSQIPVGGSVSSTLGGQPILLSQLTAGKVDAFSAICTHQGCTVAPAGKEFDCPCHGSRFNAATGAVLQGPAPSPLHKLKAVVSGDSVTISA